MEDNRPNPDDLLQAINREESKQRKGRLKIFLGMAAGVGKTYAMLEAGQRMQKEGANVLVGVINTHGRQETAKLVEGLTILPLKKIMYKDTLFEEFDLDEVLHKNPELVLIDELAHTNVPGSRHPKRWQDVIEILDNGIDVYTTINVQHIESLKDIVESITNIIIRETVPDILIETANYIELIDLTPTELLQRLKEGKVYLGNQSELAAKNFFKEDRLTALRELVLRFAAEKVDHELHGMLSTIERTVRWKPRERLMVAISQSPNSQKLVRTTRRLAFTLNAPWIAIHVNTGQQFNEDDRIRLDQNISLARELGAEIITISDTDIADAIQRVAKQKGVTQIIVGRAPKKPLFNYFSKFNLIEKLTKKCTDIDIHIIRQPTASFYQKARPISLPFPTDFSPFALIALLVCLISGICWFTLPIIGYKSIGYIFLLSILIFSFFFKLGPIFFAATGYAFIWFFFFIPHVGTDYMISKEDQALVCIYLITSLVTGLLNEKTRKQKEMLARREASARSLFEITKEMATSSTSEQVLITFEEKLGKILHGTCEVLVKKDENGLYFDENSKLARDEKEKNAALWVFENGKEAGWSTSTLPATKYLYIPLTGFNEIVGVLAYKPDFSVFLSIDEKNFVYTVGQQLATYLERVFSKERERHVENLNQIDQIYQNIFRAISEQLQAPLMELSNFLSNLREKAVKKLDKSENDIINKMEDLCQGIIGAMENVSIMAKLISGLIPNKKQYQNIQKIIEKCVEKVQESEPNRTIILDIENDLPPAFVDSFLIELLLYNLIYNAIDNSPENKPIKIEALRKNSSLVISVLDEGKGIPENLLNTIFERLYRVPGSTKPGIGLGLAIAKNIAQLHQGRMKAENREKDGAKISFILPVEEER